MATEYIKNLMIQYPTVELAYEAAESGAFDSYVYDELAYQLHLVTPAEPKEGGGCDCRNCRRTQAFKFESLREGRNRGNDW